MLEQEFVTVDMLNDSQVADEDGSGAAQIVFGPPGMQVYWLVERIAVHSDSSSSSALGVYVGSVDALPQELVDYTGSGNNDAADENQPILVEPGQKLVLQWSGLSTGAKVYARIQYRVVAKVQR